MPDDLAPPPLHREGCWRRASLLCGLGSSYGLIVSQGWSGQAEVAPSILNFGLMVLAVVFMHIADWQKAPRRDKIAFVCFSAAIHLSREQAGAFSGVG